MNRTRLLHASSLLLGVAAAACTDSPAPPPSAPIALTTIAHTPLAAQAGQPEAGGGVAAFKVNSRRDVPAKYRWVGEEHNRLLSLITRDYDDARKRGLVTKGNRPRDCRWMWDRIRREAPETARKGGFAGLEREVTDAAEPAVLRMEVCQSLDGFALLPEAAAPYSRPRGEGRVEITEAAFDVIEEARDRIGSALSMEDIDAAIGDAASEAASLKGADAEAVYAVLAVARASANYWAGAIPGPQRWSLFGSSARWFEFTEFVSADFGGCAGALSFMRLFSAAAPMNLKIGVCALSGAVASGMQYLQ